MLLQVEKNAYACLRNMLIFLIVVQISLVT